MTPSGEAPGHVSHGSARVITVSTRAASGEYSDTAGPAAAQTLREHGFAADDVVVVADGSPVYDALRDALDLRYDLILTVGGTGIAPSDETPEQTRRLLEWEIPGVAEYIRSHSWKRVPTAALSRGVCGVTGSTLILNVPGSRSAAIECVSLSAGILAHAVAQLRGVDHERDQHG